MKFLSRSLIGIFLMAVTLGLLLLAGAQVFWAVQESQNDERRSRPTNERVFAVNVDTLVPTSVVPIITSFGTVKSWRSLEIRASVAGELSELSPEFRDGGHVDAGQLLYSVDPSKLESSVALVGTELAEARAELEDAKAAILLIEAEYEIVQNQHTLREQAMTRQEDLKDRGVATDADIETAALALSSSEQALLGNRQNLAQAETRVWRADIAVKRSEISLADAERVLGETSLNAPFAGVLSEVTAVFGGLVSANEKLAVLIDPTALEIAFRVSNSQVSRLVDADGQLRELTLRATLELENLPFVIDGKIERVGAAVGDGQTGRILYARLDSTGSSILRPGDFLTVEISEEPLNNVAVIPAAAVTSDGRLLMLGDEDRLTETTVEILRRQADTVIITDAPFGQEYVTARSQQVDVGIKVRPLREGVAEVETAELPPETIALDDERRAKLIAFINDNQRMPTDVKERILSQLQEAEVPKDVVDRLESRMGG